jgi:hypothetical protein
MFESDKELYWNPEINTYALKAKETQSNLLLGGANNGAVLSLRN